MVLEYRNRQGDTYWFFEGQTKSGKPKYYASKKSTSASGRNLDVIPDGYEIFEQPSNGTVILRRYKPSVILQEELALVSHLVLELTSFSCQRSTIDGNYIVVYTPVNSWNEKFAENFGDVPSNRKQAWIEEGNFSTELRFCLVNPEDRLFVPERYCHLSSINGWINAGAFGPLEKVARQILPKLGTEDLCSFC